MSVDVANDVYQYLLFLEKQDILNYKFLDDIEGQVSGRMLVLLLFNTIIDFDLLGFI